MARADTPLRYNFELGERLIYERRVRVLSIDGKETLSNYREQIQFWCLADDINEDFLLAEMIRTDDRKKTETYVTAFHVDHRGQRRFEPEMLERIEGCDPILEMIPVLPTVLEADQAWLSPPDHYGRQWSSRRAPQDARDGIRIEFTLQDPTKVTELWRRSQRGFMTYDPESGCITRIETDTTDQDAGQRIVTVAILHARLSTGELWSRQRMQDWEKTQRVLRQHDRLLERLWNERVDAEHIAADLERLWSELEIELAGSPDNPIQRYAHASLERVRAERPRLLEQANLAKQWLGAKAAQWSLQTPDGKTLASETLRVRNVLECFWSASAPDCLHSFELLRRLAADEQNDSVTIVCLNIDTDVARAGRTIDLCGSGLTHVLAGAPLEGPPPRTLPVYRLLSPDSRILCVFFGWQPNLRERISEKIR